MEAKNNIKNKELTKEITEIIRINIYGSLKDIMKGSFNLEDIFI
jgi:hypothetical protein